MENRNLIITLAIAALITVSVMTAGCTTNTSPSPTPTSFKATTKASGNSATTQSAAGFKITYPKKYKTDQNESTPVKLYIYLSNSNKIDAVAIGTDDSYTGNNATLYNVTTGYSDLITRSYSNLSVTAKENTTLSANPAFRIVYTGILPVQYTVGGTPKPQELKVNQVWTVKNDRVYSVTYKALKGDYDKYLPQAEQIMKTFLITQ